MGVHGRCVSTGMGRHLITGPEVGHWVAEQTRGSFYEAQSEAIGLKDGDKIVAGVIYENYNHQSSVIISQMPKTKTHSSAKKRFKVTGTGKVKRKHAYKSHILTKKETKRKRNLTHPGLVSSADMGRVNDMLVRG